MSEPRVPAIWDGDRDDARLERRLRLVAPPLVLAVAWLALSTDFGRSVFRTFLTMWIHELGHAVTAWFAGHAAFPLPWRTPVSDGRSVLVGLVVAATLGGLAYRAWRAERRVLAGACAALLVLQGALTLGLRARSARELIVFGGDAGMLVLGSLLVLSFWSAPGSYLHRNWLRWGFLVIGAFAFVDAFTTWWGARSDWDRIPFGEIEGVGLSDPSQLVETFGWGVRRLVRRYVAIGVVCGLVLAGRWVVELLRPSPSAQRVG